MTSAVRRAGAFAAVGSLGLAVPLLREAAAAPFVVIAAIAVFGLEEGPVFELFARPGERHERRLYGLIGFTLSASGLALLSVATPMPLGVGVGTILLVAYGNLTAQVVRTRVEDPAAVAFGFAVGGSLAYAAGQVATLQLAGTTLPGRVPTVAGIAFLAASGGFVGALLRALLYASDDPYVMLGTGLWLWLCWELIPGVTVPVVAAAICLTVAVGYVSYALETASVSGMLTGISMGLVTIVLGGLEWFLVLIAFFGVGGLSTKFRYDRKLEKGVAEANEGARSTENVLANSAVGLVAVLAFAAADYHWTLPNGDLVFRAGTVDPTVFAFAFVGSLATAMADTLSSEVGGAYDGVRLITTLEPVDPGTDGGITWQGELAGIAGATLVAAVAVLSFGAIGPLGGAVVVVAGFVGMTVDSLLGATVEGRVVGNAGVNFLATVFGALVAGGVVAAGLV